jgi:hypothetical protein
MQKVWPSSLTHGHRRFGELINEYAHGSSILSESRVSVGQGFLQPGQRVNGRAAGMGWEEAALVSLCTGERAAQERR